MKTISTSMPQTEKGQSPILTQPVFVSLVFFVAVIILRYAEIYIPVLNTLPDKAMASRILGFLLVLGYLWMLRRPIQSIGLHGRNIGKAFLIGGFSLIILYVVLYTIQFISLGNAGETPRFVFGAINKETAIMGSLYFTLFYLFGQIVNAFMEESIFRGVILPNLMQRFKVGQAITLQALLFGLAHLIWPLNNWMNGRVTTGEAMADAGMLFISTTLGGLVFGYLYYRTGNLWTAIFAHFVDNVVGLFFHIQTANRLNAETDILMIASLGFLALVVLVKVAAKRLNLPALKPGQSDALIGL